MKSIWQACLLALVCLTPAMGHAQSAGAVRRLVTHGRMERGPARALARLAHERLVENARSGGDGYDLLRQRLGVRLFGGPGDTRAEYDARLRQVLARLAQGLTEPNLEDLFSSGQEPALFCARTLRLPMGDCDALVAASLRMDADLPHLPPEDGAALEQELSQAGLSAAQAREVRDAMHAVLLSVPSSIDETPRGRRLGALLAACPGGLTDLGAQVRAWHLGPTSGMVQCVVREVGRRAGRNAPAIVQETFGVRGAAVPLLRWAHGQRVVEPMSRDAVMRRARDHYQARRWADAAQAYARVTEQEPGYVGGWQGLAVSRMQQGDWMAAADAYRRAARLAPRDADLQVGLARALARGGDRAGAEAAYRMALTLQPGRADATDELAALTRPSADEEAARWRAQAREHFRARRFPLAAAAYREVVARQPGEAAAHAGLGASLLAQGDARGAVEAYVRATQLAPSQAGFFAALGAAQERAGDVGAATASYRRALAIDPGTRVARDGLARLGPRPAPAPAPATEPEPAPAPSPGLASALPTRAAPAPPPPSGPTLPETPGRADIVRTLAPVAGRLGACNPELSATLRFRMLIEGATGAVSEAELLGEHAGADYAACMEGHVRGVRFPRFSRESIQIEYPFEVTASVAPTE
ncbi:MAG: tetratricopeptide repeat protein [Sandaracinaceae bacterium]